jgi:hypothetical protein
VRIVRMPSGIGSPGYAFPEETRRVYRLLIERGRAQRICEVDEWGVPWIECRFPRHDPPGSGHFLALNDDGWVRVKSRLRRRRG